MITYAIAILTSGQPALLTPIAALSHPLMHVIIRGKSKGSDRTENNAPRALALAIIAAMIVVPAPKPSTPLMTMLRKKPGRLIW
jgi:hypothetical protein